MLQDHVVPFLQQVFMAIVTSIFRVLSIPADAQDQVAETDIRLLRRNYFSFIAALLNNNVAQVLCNQGMIVVRILLAHMSNLPFVNAFAVVSQMFLGAL